MALFHRQRLCYAPATEFRSSKIIDLVRLLQDTTVVESKVCSMYNSTSKNGQSNCFFSYSGQSLWQGNDLPPKKRGDLQIRAESVSKKSSVESSDYWQKMDRDDDGGIEDSGIWDANAENVRRQRFKRMSSKSAPDLDESRLPLRESNSRSQSNEWDYESELRNDAEQDEFWKWWQWWRNEDDNGYVDEDDEDDDPSWLSLLNGDVKEAFLLLRWGLPAVFLLCTAVFPWMMSNPLMLLLGFTVFPTLTKYLGPLAKELFVSASSSFGGPSSRRKRAFTRANRRSQDTERRASSTRRSQETATYSDTQNGSSSSASSSSRSYGGGDSGVSREKVRLGQSGDFGGWDDLVEDRSRAQLESKWPIQRRPKSGKKLVKKEKPLFIRLLLAFFPFLRGWGGLL